jgi:hypothetical protein
MSQFSTLTRSLAGLLEIMAKNYCSELSNTYAQGSAPINGVFVLASLLQCQSGYTEIICNHWMLWMDVPVE